MLGPTHRSSAWPPWRTLATTPRASMFATGRPMSFSGARPSRSLPPLPPPEEAEPAPSTPPSSTPSPSTPPTTWTPTPPVPPPDAAPPPPPAPTAVGPSDRPLSAWATRPLGLELHLGFGTPLGFAGVAVDYALAPAVSVEAGLGLGAAGPQGAVSARLRVPTFSTRSAPYLGVGLSAGPFNTPESLPVDGGDGGGNPTFHWNMAYWANFEAGGETRMPSNVTLRAYAGMGWMLNSGAGQVVESNPEPPSKLPAGTPGTQWLFYVGGSIGYAIGP